MSARAPCGLPSLPVLLCFLLAAWACASPRAVGPMAPSYGNVPSQGPHGDPRAVLSRFIEALEARDFEAAHGLLSASLRARYSPSTLEADFHREPLALERVERLRQGLTGLPVRDPGGVSIPLPSGGAVRLVLEEGALWLEALE